MGSLKVPVTAVVDCAPLLQPTLQWVPNIHTLNEEVCFCRDVWIECLWSSLGQYGNAGCIRKHTTVERTGDHWERKKVDDIHLLVRFRLVLWAGSDAFGPVFLGCPWHILPSWRHQSNSHQTLPDWQLNYIIRNGFLLFDYVGMGVGE